MSKWYDYIAEPNFADAIMNRLINNATHIELKRESMRKRWKKQLCLQKEITDGKTAPITMLQPVSFTRYS